MHKLKKDPSFSQFYANRIYLNPALTGLEDGITFAGVYRTQWKNVDSGFKTYTASVEIQEPFIRSGFGLSVFQDVQGLAELQTTNIGLSYKYMIPINEEQEVHIGMQALWYQKTVDYSKITFSDQLDPVRGVVRPSTFEPGLPQVSYADFNVGVVWRFITDAKIGKRRFKEMRNSIGLSLHHVPNLFGGTGVDESLQNLGTRTPPRMTIHAGTIIPLLIIGSTKKRISVSPNIKYDVQGNSLLKFQENLIVSPNFL